MTIAPKAPNTTLDLILLGGGLACGLIAFYLKKFRPEVRFLMFEQGSTLGGNHTWSFYTSDLTPEQFRCIQILVSKSWDAYTVHFPTYTKTLDCGYHSVLSERFHDVLVKELEGHVVLNAQVISATPHSVFLADGTCYTADCVVDGRGFSPHSTMMSGYQKFVGINLTLEQPHGLTHPTIMDARVPQSEEGFRFVYLLPWSETSVLVEDTYYSNSPVLDVGRLKKKILFYAEQNNWKIKSLEREEASVLPIPLMGDWRKMNPSTESLTRKSAPHISLPQVGVRGGFFHYTTGYSLPYAVRFAAEFCQLKSFHYEEVLEFQVKMSQRIWRQGTYLRILNRMLFWAAQPEKRFVIFQMFYKSHNDLIGKFYAGFFGSREFLKTICHKPPVPIFAALKSIFKWESSFLERKKPD